MLDFASAVKCTHVSKNRPIKIKSTEEMQLYVIVVRRGLGRGRGSMEPEESLASVSFDSRALDGLRGLASFHIMLLHVFMLGGAGINVYGQVWKTFKKP